MSSNDCKHFTVNNNLGYKKYHTFVLHRIKVIKPVKIFTNIDNEIKLCIS